jgi:large subunit ribosomal protein L13
MKTYSPKPGHIERRWYVLDADGQVLGRLASEAAALLRGKHKPIFAPHMDVGDHVIIVNAEKAVLTGGKETKKVAYRHSGYPGGITGVRYDRLMAERPAFAVEKAVRGMLPKNRLGRAMSRKLHVVAGPDHPHRAQQPVALAPGERPRWEGLPQPTPLKPRHVKGPQRAEADDATARPGAAKGPSTARTTATKRTTKKATSTATTAKATTAKRSTASAKRTSAKPTTRKASTAKRSTTTRTKRPSKDEEG